MLRRYVEGGREERGKKGGVSIYQSLAPRARTSALALSLRALLSTLPDYILQVSSGPPCAGGEGEGRGGEVRVN